MIDPGDACLIPGCGRRGDPRYPCMKGDVRMGDFCPLHSWQSKQQRLPQEFRRPAREVFGWSLRDTFPKKERKEEEQATL